MQFLFSVFWWRYNLFVKEKDGISIFFKSFLIIFFLDQEYNNFFFQKIMVLFTSRNIFSTQLFITQTAFCIITAHPWSNPFIVINAQQCSVYLMMLTIQRETYRSGMWCISECFSNHFCKATINSLYFLVYNSLYSCT